MLNPLDAYSGESLLQSPMLPGHSLDKVFRCLHGTVDVIGQLVRRFISCGFPFPLPMPFLAAILTETIGRTVAQIRHGFDIDIDIGGYWIINLSHFWTSLSITTASST